MSVSSTDHSYLYFCSARIIFNFWRWYLGMPFSRVQSENSLFFPHWPKHLILNETLPYFPNPNCLFSLLRPPVCGGHITITALISLYCTFYLHVEGPSTCKSLGSRNCLNYPDFPHISVPSTWKELSKCFWMNEWVALIHLSPDWLQGWIKNVLHSQVSNVMEVTELFENFLYYLIK